VHWETFEHEADVGVRGTGETLAEAFAGAATALISVICDPRAVQPREAVDIACAAPELDLLLVDWLNALVFAMATRHMLFSRFEVTEAVDAERHQPAAEVKGVSFCELRVARQADGAWLAQCVVDV